MPDKKPTDAEIKKALECCVSEQYTCRDCPYQEIKHYSDDKGFEIMPNGKRYDDWSCERWLNIDLLALLNRLQADRENYKQIAENQQKIILDKAFEIKRLKAENERLKEKKEKCFYCTEQANKKISAIKTEAYKEFAEKMEQIHSSNRVVDISIRNDVKHLLKELVGEDNG